MTPRPKRLGKWTRRNVIVEDALWRKLRERALAENRTAADLVREAISEYIGKSR